MKVFLWVHEEGVFLINEDKTKWAKPYFVTHPHRMILLKDRYNPKLMDKVDLLITVTDDELQQLVNEAIIKWKPMVGYIKDGLHHKYIAEAKIK